MRKPANPVRGYAQLVVEQFTFNQLIFSALEAIYLVRFEFLSITKCRSCPALMTNPEHQHSVLHGAQVIDWTCLKTLDEIYS